MRRLLSLLLFTVALIVGLTAAILYGIGWFLSPQNALQKSDAIIAISGSETVSRTLEAVRLYKAGWAPTVIFSGAASDPASPSNALTMKRLAVEQGVPSDSILLDEVSTNTLENASDVAYIVKSQNYHRVILVTSPYHQRRASVAFTAALGKGVTIINHSTTDSQWRRSHWWATSYTRELTLAELQKTVFVFSTDKAGLK